jgi:flagellar hook-length control protein FliK
MINFKISDLSAALVTITKPAGKPISLNVGEIIKADVTDLLSTGGVTLKIKDSYITARTDIPLQKDSQVMLKVLASPSSPNELKLQFLGPADSEQTLTPAPQNEALAGFVRELSGLNADTLSSEKIAALLKALPADINEIPKEIRLQVQNILQEGLRLTGSDIQSRLDALFRALPSSISAQSSIQGLRFDVTVSAEALLSDGLKGLLRDTGVALEAKLKAVADMMPQVSKTGAEGEAAKTASGADIRQMLSTADRASIENDLKTNLLRLRETLVGQSETVSPKDQAAIKASTAAIDGVLKDIESYQLMSRTTDSYYTFLPVSWQELKDGEISFKNNSREGRTTSSSSCRLDLDLQEFGRVVISVLMSGDEFLVSFRPDNDTFRELLTSNLEGLAEQFRGKGLSLKAARVLDIDDDSMDQPDSPEPFGRIVSIQA